MFYPVSQPGEFHEVKLKPASVDVPFDDFAFR